MMSFGLSQEHIPVSLPICKNLLMNLTDDSSIYHHGKYEYPWRKRMKYVIEKCFRKSSKYGKQKGYSTLIPIG